MALDRGKQLWAVAAYAEYRLCLDGPGEWAARALELATGRFALGPLPEVAASSHTWAELAPHLVGTPQAAMVAHERVVRGEDLSRDEVAIGLPPVLDLPLRLLDWEPRYALPEYGPDKVESPPPQLPRLDKVVPQAATASPTVLGSPTDREVVAALEDLASGWTTASNGRAEAVGVAGSALEAVGALGAHPGEVVKLPAPAALGVMAWAASSGGAHGRRKGAAPGRFGAWAVLAALAGIAEDWAGQTGQLGQVAQSACWYAWGSGEPATGWELRIAVEVPALPAQKEARAFALSAVDAY